MKAIKVIAKTPVLVDVPDPKGDGARVRVVSSSICGSGLHMWETGYFGEILSATSLAGSPTTVEVWPLGPLTVVAIAVFVMPAIAFIASRVFPYWALWLMAAWLSTLRSPRTN